MNLREKLIAEGKKPKSTPIGWELFGQKDLTYRKLSGSEMDDYEAERVTVSAEIVGGETINRSTFNTKNERARFVIRVLGDQNGQRIFRDQDIAEVGQWDGEILGRLYDEGQEYNGYKTPVKKLKKNCDPPPNDSGTA